MSLRSLTLKARVTSLAESVSVRPTVPTLAKAKRFAPRALEEAAKAKVEPSENVAEDCLAAANHIRESLKLGDKAEGAAAKLAQSALNGSKATDEQGLRRAVVDINKDNDDLMEIINSSKAEVDPNGVALAKGNSLYKHFQLARDTGYKLAAAWGLPTKVSSEAKESPDITTATEQELAKQISDSAKVLQTNVRDFLEKGATAQKLLRAASKKLGLESGELGDDEKQAVVTALLEFRSSANPLFGRTNGIVRRVKQLQSRSEKAKKYESTLETDPELAGYELI
jgi:hypothetical protein